MISQYFTVLINAVAACQRARKRQQQPRLQQFGKFWMELATIRVPADSGLAQYYTEEASGLFRARISQTVRNGTVTVTPLVSRGRPDRPDRTKVV
jgi:hypothetical protein